MTKNVVSNESNVKQVVTKIQLGEGDAGIVYGTDVTRDVANDLTQIAIPTPLNIIGRVPDRTDEVARERGGRAGLHRLRHRRGRPGDPQEVRLPDELGHDHVACPAWSVPTV